MRVCEVWRECGNVRGWEMCKGCGDCVDTVRGWEV